jgi:hypothetical protein
MEQSNAPDHGINALTTLDWLQLAIHVHLAAESRATTVRCLELYLM